MWVDVNLWTSSVFNWTHEAKLLAIWVLFNYVQTRLVKRYVNATLFTLAYVSFFKFFLGKENMYIQFSVLKLFSLIGFRSFRKVSYSKSRVFLFIFGFLDYSLVKWKTLFINNKNMAIWRNVLLVSVYKKGDPWICGNYSKMYMLCISYKIPAIILYKRIMPFAKNVFGDYQCGFKRNRSTTDQIFTISQILEKNWEHVRLLTDFYFYTSINGFKRSMETYEVTQFST